MVTADFIVLGGGLILGVIGALVGFGKGLSVITKGVVGWIISFIGCYFLLGLVTELQFVKDFMLNIVNSLSANEAWWAKVLIAIRIDVIAVSAILFLIITLFRLLLVRLIKAIMEVDVLPMVIINKTLGLVLFVGFFLALGLTVFQIIAWVGGETAVKLASALEGSFLKLDQVYANNPMLSFIEIIKASKL